MKPGSRCQKFLSNARLQKTSAYPGISYHSTEKLKLNLYVFSRRARHKEFILFQIAQLYSQTADPVFVNKDIFGFRQLRLKRQELPRVALLWFLVCVSYAICFLHFEKSAERWIRAYNTRSTKTYSLIFVIKRTLETTWEPDIFLDPYFPISDCAG